MLLICHYYIILYIFIILSYNFYYIIVILLYDYYFIILYCIVLYCIVLYCIVLYYYINDIYNCIIIDYPVRVRGPRGWGWGLQGLEVGEQCCVRDQGPGDGGGTLGMGAYGWGPRSDGSGVGAQGFGMGSVEVRGGWGLGVVDPRGGGLEFILFNI